MCIRDRRIGYVLSPNSEAMEQVTKMQYYVTACSNDAMQYAVLAAMEQASDYPGKMRDEFQTRRDLICSRLNEMEGSRAMCLKGLSMSFQR